MSNYFIGTTKTIDDLFEPLQNEIPNPDTEYKNNSGNDFSDSYAPYINGATKAVITNYIVNDSTNYPLSPLDLNEIFKRKVILPIGTITIYASSTIPTDYLLCNGQPISRTNYSDLFTLIGTTYGSGDGSTTFNIPNFNTNESIPYYDTNTLSYGSSGGSNNIVITSNNLPLHTHAQSLTLSQHTHNVNTLNSITKYYSNPQYINKQFGDLGAYRLVNAAETAWPTQTDGPTSNTINGTSGTNSNTNSVTINVQNPYLGINYIIKCI